MHHEYRAVVHHTLLYKASPFFQPSPVQPLQMQPNLTANLNKVCSRKTSDDLFHQETHADTCLADSTDTHRLLPQTRKQEQLANEFKLRLHSARASPCYRRLSMYESQRAITYPSIHLFILINLYTSRLFPAGIKDRILAFMKKKKKPLKLGKGDRPRAAFPRGHSEVILL